GGPITGDVVRGVDAVDPTAAGVAPTERAEVEPGDVVVGHPGAQATAAGRAGDRGAVTVAHRDGSLRLGIGRVDHRRPSLSGAGHDETGEAAPAPSGDLARFLSAGRHRMR